MKSAEISENGGKTYYISANGTSNDGTNINDPMNLIYANTKTFYSNDKILLKRGDIFYCPIRLKIIAEKDNICYIGTYGSGEMPIISAAKIVGDNWKKYNSELYYVDLSDTNNFDGIKNTDQSSCNIGEIISENGMIFSNINNNLANLKSEGDYYCDGKNVFFKCNEDPFVKYGKLTCTTKLDLLNVSSNCNIENLHIMNTSAHRNYKKE